MAISREIGDQREAGTHLNNLGIAYSVLGEARKAIAYYEQALTITREVGGLNGVAHILYNMSILYDEQKELDRALASAREAADIFAEIESPYAENGRNLVAQLEATSTNKN